MLLYFLLIRKKKYSIKQPENALIFHKKSDWGFGYGDNAIIIYDNCTETNNNYVNNGSYNIPEKFELNGEEYHFTVKSFEIYNPEY